MAAPMRWSRRRKRVNIHTDKGIVKAIFGWPAIHVRKVEQDKAPTIETMFLDCGATI